MEGTEASSSQVGNSSNAQASAASYLRPPKPLDCTLDNVHTLWKPWREELQLYMTLAHPDKSEKHKVNLLKYLLGPVGRQVYMTLPFTVPEEERSLNDVFQAFDERCSPSKNETVERYKFFTRNQLSGESFDSFATELRILASTCNFSTLEDSLIRDRIIVGLRDPALRERLLRETKLDLSKCLMMCRSTEITKQRLKDLNDQSTDVHGIRTKHKKHQKPKARDPVKKDYERLKICRYCGERHKFGIGKCPAYGKTCSKCQRKNHFAAVCLSSKTQYVRNVETSDSSEDEETDLEEDYEEVLWMESLDDDNDIPVKQMKDQLLATMMIGSRSRKQEKVVFEIDSGAHCNIINAKYLKNIKHNLEPTTKKLKMYDQHILVPIGKSILKFTNPKNNKNYKAEFIIIAEDSLVPILGRDTSLKMNLIELKTENILAIKTNEENWTQQYEDVFEDRSVGEFEEECQLKANKEIHPKVHAPRRVPEASKEPLKIELERLEDLGVIVKVNEPTPWVSSLVPVIKPHKTRICIDTKDLNRALQRSHYPMKTLDDILPQLSRAKIFSLVDVKDGYWHVKLDEESSKLTTFNSIYGRYRWTRIPFGLKVSAEEFQRRLEQSLEGLDGVCCVADDILIYGEGDTEDEATQDHNKKLHALLQRCREKNIKLNKKKAKFQKKELKFMGHTLSDKGLKPDEEKVKAVMQMPLPTDVAGVRRIIGFVTYLSRFMPQLSDLCQPLRKLTESNTAWDWTDNHSEAMDKIKKTIASHPVLCYFDNDKALTLQADSSETGLGAALMHEDQPIAFSSRALHDEETRYAQIEKELLAVVWGLEKFHQYTYGRHVTVQSDHKPLEIIQKKPLHKAPKRLQRLLLRLQAYDCTIVYKPGKEMYLADTLSRAYLPASPEDRLRSSDLHEVHIIEDLPISENRLREIIDATKEDPVMQQLKNIIMNGWPESKKKLPLEIREFFTFREELTYTDGLIMKGDRVIIPKQQQQILIQSIHSSHLGIESCLRRARECLYWPNMNQHIQEYIQRCTVCRTLEYKQQKETMIPHKIPNQPWSKIGTDLFHLDGRSYLITVDYYSKFWEIDYLESTTTNFIISKLKGHFARYGIPDTLISDNGPQYTSDQFQKFTKKWKIQHLTSSPAYPQSNGQAESAVKIAKRILKKAKLAGSDPYLAILDFRNTPTEGLQTSPAQRLMSRRTQTLLPMKPNLLKPQVPSDQKPKFDKKKQAEIARYNKNAKALKPLKIGDAVRIQPTDNSNEWYLGHVIKKLSERSYEVITERGAKIRRNRKHLRPAKDILHQQPNQHDLHNKRRQPIRDEPSHKRRQPIRDEPNHKRRQPIRDKPNHKRRQPIRDEPNHKRRQPIRDEPIHKRRQPIRDEPIHKRRQPIHDELRQPIRDEPNRKRRQPIHDELRQPTRDEPNHKRRQPVCDEPIHKRRQPIHDELRQPIRDEPNHKRRQPIHDELRQPIRDEPNHKHRQPIHDELRQPTHDEPNHKRRQPTHDEPTHKQRQPIHDELRQPTHDEPNNKHRQPIHDKLRKPTHDEPNNKRRQPIRDDPIHKRRQPIHDEPIYDRQPNLQCQQPIKESLPMTQHHTRSGRPSKRPTRLKDYIT